MGAKRIKDSVQQGNTLARSKITQIITGMIENHYDAIPGSADELVKEIIDALAPLLRQDFVRPGSPLKDSERVE